MVHEGRRREPFWCERSFWPSKAQTTTPLPAPCIVWKRRYRIGRGRCERMLAAVKAANAKSEGCLLIARCDGEGYT
ncbi:hypothetical protein IMZ17_15190 [Geobacillus stearothermophilus]|nr:hypothetical protein IMZ17_15190 [Geobacillus stearothermophilus]